MPMNVTAISPSPTSLLVSWDPPSFAETIDHYFISWSPVELPTGVLLEGGMLEEDCVSANAPVLGTANCSDVVDFTITGLEEYVEYRVTVVASNDVGNSSGGSTTERTLPDSEWM